MKITMYELLGMIKDGKAPKKIKVYEAVYINNGCNCYLNEKDKSLCNNVEISMFLNDEIVILDNLEEEKKIPEKLNTWYGIEPVSLDSPTTFKDNSKYIDFNNEMFFDKINEIIDYLKSKGE